MGLVSWRSWALHGFLASVGVGASLGGEVNS